MAELEQMVAELKMAGWKIVRPNIWQAPSGSLFCGPPKFNGSTDAYAQMKKGKK